MDGGPVRFVQSGLTPCSRVEEDPDFVREALYLRERSSLPIT